MHCSFAADAAPFDAAAPIASAVAVTQHVLPTRGGDDGSSDAARSQFSGRRSHRVGDPPGQVAQVRLGARRIKQAGDGGSGGRVRRSDEVDAPAPERLAAEELQRYLRRISGATLPASVVICRLSRSTRRFGCVTERCSATAMAALKIGRESMAAFPPAP